MIIGFSIKKEVRLCGLYFDCIVTGQIDHQREERDVGIPESFTFDDIFSISVYDYAEKQYLPVDGPLKALLARKFESDNVADDVIRAER